MKGCRHLKLTIGTQDKAKEEEDNKTHNFSLNVSIVSLLLISKSEMYKLSTFIYSLEVLKNRWEISDKVI